MAIEVENPKGVYQEIKDLIGEYYNQVPLDRVPMSEVKGFQSKFPNLYKLYPRIAARGEHK